MPYSVRHGIWLSERIRPPQRFSIGSRGVEDRAGLEGICGFGWNVRDYAGALMVVARLARLGFLANFLRGLVLIGFLTGVGIQVACRQVAGMLGVPDNARFGSGRELS